MNEPHQHHANVTLGDVTSVLPMVEYAICVDSSSRPHNHVGDWPDEQKIYPVRAMESKMDGIPVVHVLGFQGEAPYFNAYSVERFVPLFQLWLN